MHPIVSFFLFTEDENDLEVILRTLQHYVTSHDNLIPKIATDYVISKLCFLLTSKNVNIFTAAAVTLSGSFVYAESPEIIDKAILEGVLQKFLDLLYSGGCSDLIKKILWGISNISGGHNSHVAAFIQEEELV